MIKINYNLAFDFNGEESRYGGLKNIVPFTNECAPKNLKIIIEELTRLTGKNCFDYFDKKSSTGEIIVMFGVDLEYQFPYKEMRKHSPLFKRNFVVEESIKNVIEEIISFINFFIEQETRSMNCISERCILATKSGTCLDFSEKNRRHELNKLHERVKEHSINAQRN